MQRFVMYGLLLAAATVLIANANACTTDSDCPDGCCFSDNRRPTPKCYNVSHLSEPCHLPNHHVTFQLYPCGCAQGLVCDEIHFDLTFPDPVHDAENILLHHGYGICMTTVGNVLG
ncbi:uncharacterized protein LOC128225803 [Mya arenaria]|uniref:uncharacterized protein LOC128225803 n=1 Tax=Mya arenaria TaxID=6604 RepID=UPI0022E64006|nr:uncharacterized protein LOC128225803 [Mya arenaria]